MAQPFTERHKAVTAEELQQRLDEIIDDIDANPDTVYHVVDEQGGAYVLISKRHYDALEQAKMKTESAVTKLSVPSDTSQT